MEKRIKINFVVTGVLFLLFALLIAAVLTLDVQPIGPLESHVGLATLNGYVFDLLGENRLWFNITDWMGVFAILLAFGFAVVGLVQWIKRKRFWLVDVSILVLGAFYLVTAAFYVLFEICIINYRPVILDTSLEASFPSSTTLLVLCVTATAAMQIDKLLKNKAARMAARTAFIPVIAIAIVGRLVSGVHWFTDIIGGVLLGSALVMLYYSVVKYIEYRKYSMKN